jgi:hypothetical protein
MAPDEYGGAGTAAYEANLAAELEVRDYYTEKNVFWVPFEARWQTLKDLVHRHHARGPAGLLRPAHRARLRQFSLTEQSHLGMSTLVSNRRSAHALLNGSGARFVHTFRALQPSAGRSPARRLTCKRSVAGAGTTGHFDG